MDIHRGEIVSDDVFLRLDRLVEDTVALVRTYGTVREAQGRRMPGF